MEFTDDIEWLIGPPVEVTEEVLEACKANEQFGALVYELYKETAGLVSASSGTYLGIDGVEIKLDRNQAICAGLLVRISKYMSSVVKLSANMEHGEAVQALNRCIIESAVNLRFLLFVDDDAVYDRFVRTSLCAERRLYDTIVSNIENRGGERFVIEDIMLQSIAEVCKQSGIGIEEVDPQNRSWGSNFYEKLKDLGIEDGYVGMYMIPSHAVHGTWVDLILNHLNSKEEGFEPNWGHLQTDGELLGPLAIFVIEAVRQYLRTFFDLSEANPLHERLDSVEERLKMVESSRQDWQVTDQGC